MRRRGFRPLGREVQLTAPLSFINVATSRKGSEAIPRVVAEALIIMTSLGRGALAFFAFVYEALQLQRCD